MSSMNKDIKLILNGMQDLLADSSESAENVTEETQDYSEKGSEQFRTGQNHSEGVQNETKFNPISSEERRRTAASCSDENTDHTITVREAARILEEAGILRTERALTNWCNRNSRGVTRLDCCYCQSQRRYYITPQSIKTAIKEEQQKALHRNEQNVTLLSSEAEQLSDSVQSEVQNDSEEMRNQTERIVRPFRTIQNDSEEVRKETKNTLNDSKDYTTNTRPDYEESTEKSSANEPLDKIEKDSLKELQMENFELKVQLEGQKYLTRKFDELVDGERERHEKEKLALVDRLTDARHQIGSLEEKLLQIEAP